MKIKILTIMITLAIIISSTSAIVGAETCGVQTESDKDPSEIVIVEKKIQSGENWVDDYQADLGETVKFKISITYKDSDGPTGPAYKIKNIVVTDYLQFGLFVRMTDDLNYTDINFSREGYKITWDLQGVELFDNQTYEIEYEAVVGNIGELVNNVDVTCLEKCISVKREVTTNATINGVCNHDYVLLDVDKDGIDEMAIDYNDNSSDGYELFFDPNYNSYAYQIYKDGDNDGKIDHFIDINIDLFNYNVSNFLPDVYWDPDDIVLSDVVVRDVEYDGTDEWVFDSNGDSKLDKYYDPDDDLIHLYIPYSLTITTVGNGNVTVYPDGDIFLKDFEVELSAEPDEGWVFDHWSGDLTGSDTTTTIKMTEDKTITANFKAKNTTTGPTVKIIKPKKNMVYFYNIPLRLRLLGTKIVGPITVKVKAESDKGIKKVEFYLNNKLKHTARVGLLNTYKWTWFFKPIELNKKYVIKVVAYDKEDKNNSDEIVVKRVRSIFIPINNRTDKKPVVEIIKPKKNMVYFYNIPLRLRLLGTKIVGPITVKVKAESDKGIKKVEFYLNNKLKHTARVGPLNTYKWTWFFKPAEPNKMYTIKVVVYDREGNKNFDQIFVQRVRYHPLLKHPLLSIGIATTLAIGAGLTGAATVGGLFLLVKNIFNKNRGTETPDDNSNPDDGSSDDETNSEPIARITAPSSGIVGEPVTFDASDSYDPDGSSTLKYTWDFGDGSTGSGVTAKHTYSSPGKYKVVLIVTDDMGGESTKSMTIQINEGEPNTQKTDLFWYIVVGLSLILLAIIGLLFVGRKIYE